MGQYLAQKISGDSHFSLKNTVFYRQDYMDEFERIWSVQAKHHPELTDELKKRVRDIIIFYQRPLKSQKGLVSICELEGREIEITCDGKIKKKLVGPRVCPKSSPLFQEFKIWQMLNNLTANKRYLSQEETSKLPEGLEAYVDYAGIGRLLQEDRGYLIEGGYVEKRKDLMEQMEAGEDQSREKNPETEKRQEAEKMEKKQGIFAVTLIRESFTDRYVRFTLPLPEQELAEKKRQAGITQEIPERVEISASIDGLLEHLPTCSTLEELNQAAKVIEEMERCSGIDWKLTFAALEAELPGTMEECCRIIRDHQSYELLPFPFLEPESYAHYYLEQAGLSLPEGLKSHFDYRRYGQEKIRKTGAAETFYGVVVNREHPICLDHGEGQELKLYSPLTLTTFAGYPLFPALLHGEKVPAFQTVIRKEIAKSMREYGAGGLAENLYNQLLSEKKC